MDQRHPDIFTIARERPELLVIVDDKGAWYRWIKCAKCKRMHWAKGSRLERTKRPIYCSDRCKTEGMRLWRNEYYRRTNYAAKRRRRRHG